MDNKPTLTYTARSIRAAESAFKTSFFDELGSLSKLNVGGLLFLYVAGGGDEKTFDELLKGSRLDELVADIASGLADSGFLEKKTADELTADMAKAKAATETSQNSGEATKA